MRIHILFIEFILIIFIFGSVNATDLTITDHWQINIQPQSHTAVLRAAKDLQDFMGRQHGLELKITESDKGTGIYLSVNEKLTDDGFSITVNESKGQIMVEAPSPRALYQGVLVLEDHLAEVPVISESLKENVSYPFKDRYLVWDVNLIGQNKMAIGFSLENHIREAVRLGYSGIECNRFLGMELLQQGDPKDPYPWYTYWGPSMDQFVSSPLFEGVFPKRYLENNLSDLKHVVEVINRYFNSEY